MTLYTIGYQGHTPTTLVAALQEHGVFRLVDVRDTPWSPAPQWQQAALRHHAKLACVPYVSIREAGNPSAIRSRAKTLLAAGRPGAEVLEWALAQYRQHLRATPGLLARIGARLQDGDCLLCACPDAARCHRGVLVDELQRERRERWDSQAQQLGRDPAWPAEVTVVHIPPASARREQRAEEPAQGRLL
jgi:uncharacterized protein (DUF488 family)